jgi:hypothetical protein
MRRFLSVLSLAVIVPLAACFDVDAKIAITGDDQAEMTMKMTIGADLVAMLQGTEQDPCEGMEGSVQDDGSYVCTDNKSGSIEELMSDPDMGEGMTIEKRDGGLYYVAFDLGDLTGDMGLGDEEMGAEEQAQMAAMMRGMFEGHSMVLHIAGAEVIETNGTISDDGKTATYVLPLTDLLDEELELPETFNALVRPGT